MRLDLPHKDCRLDLVGCSGFSGQFRQSCFALVGVEGVLHETAAASAYR